MSEHCGFNIFENCNCGGECKSGTVNLGRFTKSTDRTLNTVLAKDRAGWAVVYFITLFIAFLCIGTAGALLGKELVRMDRQIELAERV